MRKLKFGNLTEFFRLTPFIEIAIDIIKYPFFGVDLETSYINGVR
jgi:hypothetical protein